MPPELERFLRYVRVDTQSAEGATGYPSTDRQKDLSRMLVAELRDMGIADAAMDEHGIVTATVPATVPGVPVIGLVAHVDTSPDVSGANVQPRLHANYDGGPIRLDATTVLTPEQSPQLRDHVGHTIVTGDGTTLLGADDKAGVASIMTLVERLVADPSIPHGTLRIAFTPDEEVGAGTRHFDVKAFGAAYAYTVDGETAGEIENETFCADGATVTFHGVSVHPGYAKDKLVSAVKAAGRLLALLPPDQAPETTEARQGFLHPTSIAGGAERTTLKLILRDFEEAGLAAHRALLTKLAAQVEAEFPGLRVEVAFEESYRNMRFVLERHPRVVELALEAVRRAGLAPHLGFIRGGTDGARLSAMGLPTPNIFTGGHLFHSRYEWVAVEDLSACVRTLEHLVRLWAEERN